MEATSLLDQLFQTPVLDWVAIGLALIYVILAARDNNWCWPFAGVGSLIWAHQAYVEYHLLSDSLLQLFYFVMAIFGLYRWRRAGKDGQKEGALDQLAMDDGEPTKSGIRRMSLTEHAVVLSGALLLGYGLGLLTMAMDGEVVLPYSDGVTSAASVLATFLLVYRRLENWLYFVVIDLAYVYIYYRSGAYVYIPIMLIYVGAAIYGYLHWRRLLAVDRSYEAAT